MSKEEVKRFNQDVKASDSLQTEVQALPNDVSKVVEFANSKGYQFTEADIAELNKKQDLSDEELDQVSGGEAVTVGFAVVRAAVI